MEMKQQIKNLKSNTKLEYSAANLRRRHFGQNLAYSVMWLSGLITVLALLIVIGYVMVKGISGFEPGFLTTSPKGGLSGEGGILSTIVTTVYLVLMTVLIATPLGIGAGIYLVEYAGEQSLSSRPIALLVQIAHFGVETLAGIPSIIFGLFGYALFVTTLKFGVSLLSGALAGACLVLPTIIRTTEEALLAVPAGLREGSMALGATKWQTISNIVLPAAAPGIITGIILSVGRIMSETAVFFVTLGGSFNMPDSIFSSGRTMALHLYYLAMDTRAFDKAMATGVVLIVSIILVNLSINIVSRKLRVGVRD
ncbi:MAG: phosphate ABC transporter permease PstA [Anaerolineaceae bacterium]|nr:phosphate ABC transporter permease PstA [Anaerolineaceae bacterium]